MKNVKRALALLLCFVMVLSCVPTHSLAASDVANVYMELSTDQVNVDQTFTITVSYDAMKVASFGAPLSYDGDLVEFVSAVGCDPEFADEIGLCTRRGFTQGKISTPDEAAAIGQVGFVVAGTEEVSYTACDIYTATFRAKAPGTVTFTLSENSDGTNGFNGVAQIETVTIIGASTPSCDHSSTKLVSNTDGTHNVVCEACEEPIETNVPCSGTDDGDHTTAVTCACGNTVTAGAKHKDENPKDHVCDFDGCNFAMGEHKSNAAHTCVAGKCDYCGADMPATTDHAYIPGTPVWSDNNTKCTVTGTCACGATTTAVTTTISTQVTTEANCQTPEGTTHTATFTEPWVVGDVTTGSTGNTNPDKHPQESISTKDETTPATCTEEGKVETVTFCSACNREISRTLKSTIPAGTGCVLADPTYTWSSNYATCTAEVKCQHGTVHKTETVSTTSSVTTPATCTEMGWTTYTATFTEAWAGTASESIQNVPATGHTGEYYFEYSFAESSLSVGFRIHLDCDNCEEKFVISGGGSPTVKVTPTCTVKGVYTYSLDYSKLQLQDIWKWENFKLNDENLPEGAVWNEETKIMTYELTWKTDPSNHSGKPNYTTNGDGTHSATHYECCNAPFVVTNEEHTYNANNVCTACGAKAFKVIAFTEYNATWNGNYVDIYKNGVKIASLTKGTTGAGKYNEIYIEEYDPTATYAVYWNRVDDGELHWRSSVTFCVGKTSRYYEADAMNAFVNGQLIYPKCEHDDSVKVYFNNGDGTHNVFCNSCNLVVLKSQAHTYNETTHKCACGDVKHVCTDNLTHVAAKDATCTDTGIVEHWYCEHCDKYYSDAQAATEIDEDDTVAPVNPDNHKNLDHTAEDPATCDYSGLKEYWSCSDCGKYFEDADAKNEIEGWQAWSSEGGEGFIPATGHGAINGFRYVPNADPINTHTVYCKDCGDEIFAAEGCTFGDDHVCDSCEQTETMTVTFMNGDSKWDETTVRYGDTLGIVGMPIPEAPAGKHFAGWYTVDNVDVVHGMTVTSNLVAYATWEDDHVCAHHHYEYVDTIDHQSVCSCDKVIGELPHEADEYGYCACGAFALVYNYAGGKIADTGETMAPVTAFFKDSFEPMFDIDEAYWAALNAQIVKEGYTAVALAYDAEGTRLYKGEKITEPATLYLIWECNHDQDVHEYTYTDNGDGTHTVKCACGETLIESHDYTTGDADHTCICGAVEKFTITWKNPNGTVLAYTTVEYGKVPTFPAGQTPLYPDAMAEMGYDYAHIGWSEELDGEKLDSIPAATGVATYYAVYSKTAKNYRVTWTVNGEWYKETTFAYGAAITAPQAPTKEGHTFSGWDIPETMPAQNITLDATLTVNNYTVTWKINGNAYTTTNVAYGAAITAPAYNVPEGHTFSGWTVDATMPAKNMTYNATLTAKTYTVTWLVDGEEFATTQATYGQVIPTPATDPTKEGYTFQDWNTYPATMPANENLRIEAVFTANTYQVNWYANGGSFKLGGITFNRVGTDVAYDSVIAFTNYNLPTREGYTFTGWNTQADGSGESLSAETVMNTTDNLTVYYAQWEVNTYTLTVYVWAKGELVDLTVPYGANLLEVLAAAAEDEMIPALDEKIRVNNADQNGENLPYQYSYSVGEGEDLTWFFVDETTTMPAEDFVIDQDHKVNGWVFTDLGGGRVGAEYYDFEDGCLGSGWHYIEENYDGEEGGAWYYFAEGTGAWAGGWFFRVEGLTRAPYPVDDEGNPITINGNTYTPDQEAVEYAASKGKTFIDATEAWFLFDEDGKFQYDTNGDIDNYTINGVNALRYMNHGMLEWHPGLIKNGDDYYYFIGDVVNGGNIAAEGDTYITRGNDVDGFTEGHIYNFASGKLSGAHGIVDGKYYENSRLMTGNGLTKIQVEGETKYIYVRSNGYIVKSAEYYVPANDKGIVPGTYSFDENGYLVEPQMTDKDGIYWENGAWYYYENGKICYNKGLIEVTETWYDGEGTVETTAVIYVRSNGQLAKGYYYVTNMANYNGSVAIASGTKLLFDNYGAMVAPMNGIVDGKYYVDNQIVYNAGVVEIEDGKYIYVRSNGEVVMGRSYWITNVGNSGVVAKNYSFDANGYFTPEFVADQKNGIVNGYYYENGSIAYGKGLVYLEDEDCYIYVRSNGQLATGIYWPTTTNGYDFSGRYDFGNDGKLYI